MSEQQLEPVLPAKEIEGVKKLNKKLFYSPTFEFQKHITPVSNQRIIFSGKFGSGKSTFLNYFFQLDENREKYVRIHISPVNYVVSSNQDVFELIKFDVLLGLFKYSIEFECDNSNEFDKLRQYASTKFTPLFSKIINGVGLLGSGVLGDKFSILISLFGFIVDNYDSVYKDYKTFSKDLKGDVNEVDDFIDSVVNKVGSAFDESIITDIITKKIIELKGDGKEAVLVIDDLDRLDPEHIFRIINIFGCHLNYNNQPDKIKFGFDKIVLVCDYINIENIFHYKYGKNVDFYGYIDKYCTGEIFNYDYKRTFYDIVKYFTDKISFEFRADNGKYNMCINEIDVVEFIKESVNHILVILLKEKEISIRTLSNYIDNDQFVISTPELGMGLIFDRNPILVCALYVLENIVGSRNNLRTMFMRNFHITTIEDNESVVSAFITNSGCVLFDYSTYKNNTSTTENFKDYNLTYNSNNYKSYGSERFISPLVEYKRKETVNSLYIMLVVLDKIDIVKRNNEKALINFRLP